MSPNENSFTYLLYFESWVILSSRNIVFNLKNDVTYKIKANTI